MKHFRSPLLKSVPPPAEPDRGDVPRRLRKVLIYIVCILVPIFLVWFRVLPKGWPFRIFYLIHDDIFLPLEGYLYTLFYPYSLTFWGPVIVVFVSWLLCYTFMLTPDKRLQVFALKEIIHRRRLHWLLVKSTKVLKKLKLHPKLLLEFTSQEREIALNHLTQLAFNEVDMNCVKSAAYLTRLHIDLLTLQPADPEELANAAVFWHQAYLQLGIRCREKESPAQLETITNELAEKVSQITVPLLDWHTSKKKEQINKEKEEKSGFDPVSLAGDLRCLADLGCGKVAESQKQVYSQLAESVATRRAILDRARNALETGDTNRLSAMGTLSLSISLDLLSAMGALSLSIALDLSARVHSVDIGLGFLESMEMLEFQLNCTGQRVWNPRLVQLLGRAPGPRDYRVCAELAQREIHLYQKHWQNSVLREGPVESGDIEVAKSRVRSLFITSGPDFDLTQKENTL